MAIKCTPGLGLPFPGELFTGATLLTVFGGVLCISRKSGVFAVNTMFGRPATL